MRALLASESGLQKRYCSGNDSFARNTARIRDTDATTYGICVYSQLLADKERWTFRCSFASSLGAALRGKRATLIGSLRILMPDHENVPNVSEFGSSDTTGEKIDRTGNGETNDRSLGDSIYFERFDRSSSSYTFPRRLCESRSVEWKFGTRTGAIGPLSSLFVDVIGGT